MATHTTTQSETYDQIALAEYGADVAVRDMMAAAGTENPELLTVWRFPYGVDLPVPELTPGTSDLDSIPIWRRSS